MSNKLHYNFNVKKDLLTVYYVSENVEHQLGSISINNTTEETRKAFMLDMIEAKERLYPSKAPWHAHTLFDANGNLKTLSIRKYGAKPQWFLKRGDKVKTETVKPHEYRAQVEYYTQVICLEHGVPDDSVSKLVVKHAVEAMYRDVVVNNN